MACEITNGITAVCGYNSSGVQNIWISNRSSLTGTTTYTVDDCGEVTGMTFASGTTILYEFESALDSVTFSDDIQINGSRRNWLQQINFALGNVDCTVIKTLEDLGLSAVFAILKLSDGTFRLFGAKGTGLRVTVLSETSGTAAGNDATLAVTLAGTNLAKAPIIDAAYVATLGLS